jgi:hypothetical protein
MAFNMDVTMGRTLKKLYGNTFYPYYSYVFYSRAHDDKRSYGQLEPTITVVEAYHHNATSWLLFSVSHVNVTPITSTQNSTEPNRTKNTHTKKQ